ncbi:DUF6243 family protein [Nocardiopsis potens]|uniref:DUF6243 family protein n=1 Tax=Nocardiopsis potens TaxID=1246458 RepID=UPI00034C9A4F|nr:DUF6243 family protein [Nocardiopsis potens]
MAKGRGDNLLGVGGQRTKVSKSALRGGGRGKGASGGSEEARRELLERFRKRTGEPGGEGAAPGGR